MFENPVLIYSEYCKYSNDFLEMLLNTPLSQKFNYVNIDLNPNTKTRSEDFYTIKNILLKKYSHDLKAVPTIIVENGEFVLTGVDAFEWLRHILNTLHNASVPEKVDKVDKVDSNVTMDINKVESNGGDLYGFNHNEMGAFSDIYSTFGLNVEDTCTDAKSQSFHFLNETNVGGSGGGVQPKNVRFNDIKEPVIEQNHNFKNAKNKKNSAKENELNSRYEEMMSQRKAMDKSFSPPERV